MSVTQSIDPRRAVESIDTKAAQVGRCDRYHLAAIAAADVLELWETGQDTVAGAAVMVLRTRLHEAGLYPKQTS